MLDALASHLARSLEISQAEAERAVAQLGETLADELAESGEAHIEGLGTFSRGDGDVRFEPDPILQRAVNHRFEGLPLVHTKPAEPEADAPEEAEEPADPFELVGTGPELSPPEEDENTFAPIRDFGSDDDSVDPFARPFEEDYIAKEDDTAAQEPSDLDGAAPPMDEPAVAEFAPDEHDEPATIPPLDFGASREPVEESTPEETLPEDEIDSSAEAPDEFTEGDDDDDLDQLLEGIWTPRTGPVETDHPLGPLSPELLEDADYQLVGDAGESSDPHAPPPASEEPPPEREDWRGKDVFFSPTPPPPGPPKPQVPVAPDPPPLSPPVTRASPAFEATRTAPESEEDGSRRGWMPWVAAALAVVLVGAAILAWLWFQPTPGPPDPGPGPDQVVVVPPVDEDPDPAITDPDEPAPAEPVPDPTPPPEDTPLRSADGIDPAQGGYTLIVASEGTRAEAERIAGRYRADGFRVSVLPATVGGRQFFRVAVGQFSSRAQAQARRGDLPDYAPADTWSTQL